MNTFDLSLILIAPPVGCIEQVQDDTPKKIENYEDRKSICLNSLLEIFLTYA